MIKKNTLRMLAAGLALPVFLAGCNSIYMAGVTPPPDHVPPPVFTGAPAPEFNQRPSAEEFLALEDLPPVPSYPDMGIEEAPSPSNEPNYGEIKGSAWEEEMPDYRAAGMSDVLDLNELPPVPPLPDYSDPEARTTVPEWTPPVPEDTTFNTDLISLGDAIASTAEPRVASEPPAMPRVPFAEPDQEDYAPTVEERPYLEIENPYRVLVPMQTPEGFAAAPIDFYQNTGPQSNGMPQFITMPQPVPPPPTPQMVQQQRATIQATSIRPPQLGDEGRTVAEARTMSAQEFASVNKGQVPDCAGRGLGIKISNSLGDNRYNIDQDGKPCGKSETLFNGGNDAEQRSFGASGVDISFVNAEGGPQAPAVHKPDPLLVYFPGAMPPQSPDEMAQTNYQPKLEGADKLNDGLTDVEWFDETVEPQHKKYQDGTLEATVQKWEDNKVRAQRSDALSESQQLMEDLKDIRQMADGDMALHYQQQVDELMRRLRESEIKAAMAQERHLKTNEKLEMSEEERMAVEQAWREEQRRLSQEAASLNERLVEMNDAQMRLKKTYSERERSYMERIAKLTEDLKKAEYQAGTARKEMVLEAAKKIAEAERLAFAARLAERDQIVRRAERLKLEGDVMMQRADDMQKNRTVIVPGLAGDFGEEFPPAPPKMEDGVEITENISALPPMAQVPVLLHVEQMPLKDVFTEVFNQMKPMMGDWDVKWELSGEHQEVMYELWTVTAETRFEAFLDFIAKKVADTHGVTLHFNRFDKNKMFIISD